MICEVANRVNALLSRACGDKHLFALEILLIRQYSFKIIKQNLLIGHFALADCTAGKSALGRRNYNISESLKFCKIVLNNWVFIHICIHSRRNNNRTFASHNSGGEHIVGNAVCNFSDYICRCRCNNKCVRTCGKRNMRHIILNISVKGINNALMLCKLLKGERINKVCCVLRHQHIDITAFFYERTCHICRFIGGNAACYAKDYIFSFKHFSPPYPLKDHVFRKM